MPSLVTLGISHSDNIGDALIDGLCYRTTNSHNLVPKLETLYIGYLNLTESWIADMVESRWQTDGAPHEVSNLKKVAVYLRTMDYWVQKRFQQLYEEGLRISCISKSLSAFSFSDFRYSFI